MRPGHSLTSPSCTRIEDVGFNQETSKSRLYVRPETAFIHVCTLSLLYIDLLGNSTTDASIEGIRGEIDSQSMLQVSGISK